MKSKPRMRRVLLALLCVCLAFYLLLHFTRLPAPKQVMDAFQEWIMSGDFLNDITASAFRFCLGYFAGGFLGVVLGLTTGRSSLCNLTFGSILQTLRPLPIIALVPLFLVLAGLNFMSFAIVTLGTLLPTWINTHIGASRIGNEYIWASKSLNLGWFRHIRHIVLPLTTPQIVAGLRTAIGIGFVCLVAAESAGVANGVAYRVATSHLTFRVDLMVASLIVLGAMGATADYVFTLLVDLTFPWSSND